jgi:hypothetical protein
MFFVVDKPRLQRLIAITRDDRKPSQQSKAGPFFRIEARDEKLRLSGRETEAEFPATVYEPGVLFLRITEFRSVLADIPDQSTITIQANAQGLFIDNVWFDLASNDMLLYPDPENAPLIHPSERKEAQYGPQGELFPEA